MAGQARSTVTKPSVNNGPLERGQAGRQVRALSQGEGR